MAGESGGHEEGPLAEYTLIAGPRKLLSCVAWMQQHREPVDERVWTQVYALSQHARSPRTRLIAARVLADRFDPVPRAPTVQVETGPVTISWKSRSITNPASSKTSSTLPSSGSDLARRSWSATDGLENL